MKRIDLFLFLMKWPMSKSAKVILVILARISLNPAWVVYFTTCLFDSVETEALPAIFQSFLLGAEQKRHPKLQDLTLTSLHYVRVCVFGGEPTHADIDRAKCQAEGHFLCILWEHWHYYNGCNKGNLQQYPIHTCITLTAFLSTFTVKAFPCWLICVFWTSRATKHWD